MVKPIVLDEESFGLLAYLSLFLGCCFVVRQGFKVKIDAVTGAIVNFSFFVFIMFSLHVMMRLGKTNALIFISSLSDQ